MRGVGVGGVDVEDVPVARNRGRVVLHRDVDPTGADFLGLLKWGGLIRRLDSEAFSAVALAMAE